jgi:hypothetical protein
MTMDSHHAGAILNMYLLSVLITHEDAIVKSRFLGVMRMLTTHNGSRIVSKFQAWKRCRGAFPNMPLAMESQHSTPQVVGPCWQTWHTLGTHLAPLASRI